MSDLLTVLQTHAGWIFGSGGAVAAVLAVLKFFFAGKAGSAEGGKPQPVPRGATTRVTTTKIVQGRTVDIALAGAVLVAVVGLVLSFTGSSVTADRGSAVTTGDGNVTIIDNSGGGQ